MRYKKTIGIVKVTIALIFLLMVSCKPREIEVCKEVLMEKNHYSFDSLNMVDSSLLVLDDELYFNIIRANSIDSLEGKGYKESTYLIDLTVDSTESKFFEFNKEKFWVRNAWTNKQKRVFSEETTFSPSVWFKLDLEKFYELLEKPFKIYLNGSNLVVNKVIIDVFSKKRGKGVFSQKFDDQIDKYKFNSFLKVNKIKVDEIDVIILRGFNVLIDGKETKFISKIGVSSQIGFAK